MARLCRDCFNCKKVREGVGDPVVFTYRGKVYINDIRKLAGIGCIKGKWLRVYDIKTVMKNENFAGNTIAKDCEFYDTEGK